MAKKSDILAPTSFTKSTKRQLTEYDMMADAPPFYSPQWLDCLQEGELKSLLRSTYVAVRHELSDQQKGRGVSLSQDLVIRRVVYLDRTMERIEYAMEYWTQRLEAGCDQAEGMLMRYALIYSNSCTAMVQAMRLIGLGRAPHQPRPLPDKGAPDTVVFGEVQS